MVRRVELRQHVVDVSLELGEQPLLELALVIVAERVEPSAAQASQACHDAEGCHRPGPDIALAHHAGARVGSAEGPGADVKVDLVVAVELARECRAELAGREQARDLPFVLDGEKPVIGPCDRRS